MLLQFWWILSSNSNWFSLWIWFFLSSFSCWDLVEFWNEFPINFWPKMQKLESNFSNQFSVKVFFLKFSRKLAKIFGQIGLNSNELFNSGIRCIKLGKTGTFLLVFSIFLIEIFNQFDSDHSLRQKNYEKWVKFDTFLAIFANHLGWISSWMQKKNESTEQKWRWFMNQCNENDKRLFEHCKRNVDPSKFGVVMFVLFVIYLTDLISTNQEEKWWMTTTAASAWPSGELFQTPLLKSHFQWLKFNSTSPQ